jgi:flavin-dependent dehydrogenase
MQNYDIVVGGGIAGSVAARFAAKHGFKTLLVEKYKTPRNKPCSGIQFTYFEKLIGKKFQKKNYVKMNFSRWI